MDRVEILKVIALSSSVYRAYEYKKDGRLAPASFSTASEMRLETRSRNNIRLRARSITRAILILPVGLAGEVGEVPPR